MSILAASFFYVNEPIVDMKENPMHDSKVVSQTFFSEKVDVEKANGDWSFIITPDGYSGWVWSKSLVNLPVPYNTTLKTSRLAAHIYGVKDTEYGPIKTVPYCSQLQALDTTDPRWLKIALPDGRESYIQKGDVAVEAELSNKKELVEFSQKFLGLPYTWGGRSSFGYDCSGFIQMLYKQIGVNLERDSKQQILDSRLKMIAIDELKPGDLVFFGKSEQRIMHVGMYIGEGQFIQSTARENKPWIRISNLSDFEWSGHSDAYYPYRTARQLKDE
jgi:cell wall-associated NlpC family hydrolase